MRIAFVRRDGDPTLLELISSGSTIKFVLHGENRDVTPEEMTAIIFPFDMTHISVARTIPHEQFVGAGFIDLSALKEGREAECSFGSETCEAAFGYFKPEDDELAADICATLSTAMKTAYGA